MTISFRNQIHRVHKMLGNDHDRMVTKYNTTASYFSGQKCLVNEIDNVAISNKTQHTI